MAAVSAQFATTHELHEDMTLAGHKPSFYYTSEGEREESGWGPTVSYFPDAKRMVSGSGDKTTRVWDLQTGKEIEEARVVCEQEVHAVAVSRDGRWTITAGRDVGSRLPGELKAYDVKKGVVKTFEGHSGEIICIDISMNSKLLACGSWDSTTRIWNLDTGELVAGAFQSDDLVGAVRFSRDSKRIAVNSWTGRCLEVWDIEEQDLDVGKGKAAQAGTFPLDAPVFWTTNDQTIVATFSFSNDENSDKVYEFESSTLDTVGVPFKGHTAHINDLALSFDCTLLASAAHDNTIKLWHFDSRQLLASFNVRLPCSVILSPDARQVAYTTFDPPFKIHICDVPFDILAQVTTGTTNARKNIHIGDPLDSRAPTRPPAVHRNPAITSFVNPPERDIPIIHEQRSPIFRQLFKFLPRSFRKDAFPPAETIEPRDPLDIPATSTQLPSYPTPGDYNLRPVIAPPIPKLSPSNTMTSRLRHLLSSWGHSLPPIVSVPLVQGKQRNAAAGAPKGDRGYRRDEEFDSPPSSPTSNPPAAAQEVTGEHGRGRLCFCL